MPSHLRLIRPGYLPFADLPGFLGGALVVAAPSRGEGFGLQVLEAMACGAPVLTTYRTSLPEVGGDAVAYTEPDADSIAVALRALLDDPERRAALGEAGYARAQEFTWAASAAAHVASYKRAADQGSARPRLSCPEPRLITKTAALDNAIANSRMSRGDHSGSGEYAA